MASAPVNVVEGIHNEGLLSLPSSLSLSCTSSLWSVVVFVWMFMCGFGLSCLLGLAFILLDLDFGLGSTSHAISYKPNI